MANSFSYRSDIDGLRAIAVLGVVLFHAGVGIPGGYVGVDVFFVISGYLITSLILRDAKQGTFSILDFWEKRIRRILPALAVVIAFVIAAAYVLLLPDDYKRLGTSIASVGALCSNVLFYTQNDYFSPASEENPLLHTWSLSLEEQFYLFIPFAITLLYRWGGSKWIIRAMVAGCVASFALSCYGAIHYTWATFYLLPTRAWELGAGSLLAFAPAVGSLRVRSLMGTGGLLGIVFPFFLYDSSTPFPGAAALPPVAGAALLICAGMQACPGDPNLLVQRLLSSRPLVWVGLLSYSLYLWHWPLLAFYHYAGLGHDSKWIRMGLVAISILISWLSLRFVESPFRHTNLVKSRAAVFKWAAATAGVFAAFVFVLWQTGGLPQRLSFEERRILGSASDKAYRDGVPVDSIPDGLIRIGAENPNPEVLVWGDSHSMALLSVMDEVCKEAGIGGRAVTAHATAPVFGWYKPMKSGLNESAVIHHQKLLKYLESPSARATIKKVLIAARWESYADASFAGYSFEQALNETIGKLQGIGYEVTIVEEVATWPTDVPRAIALNKRLGIEEWDLKQTLVHHRNSKEISIDCLKRIEAKNPKLKVIDPVAPFVDSGGVIRSHDDNGVFYFDDNHLSIYGALRLKKAISSALGY